MVVGALVGIISIFCQAGDYFWTTNPEIQFEFDKVRMIKGVDVVDLASRKTSYCSRVQAGDFFWLQRTLEFELHLCLAAGADGGGCFSRAAERCEGSAEWISDERSLTLIGNLISWRLPSISESYNYSDSPRGVDHWGKCLIWFSAQIGTQLSHSGVFGDPNLEFGGIGLPMSFSGSALRFSGGPSGFVKTQVANYDRADGTHRGDES